MAKYRLGMVGIIFPYKGPRKGSYVLTCTRVLQKVLSLDWDYFSATFYHIFITNLQSIPPLLKHIFVTFLPSREKQINSRRLVSVGDTDK